MGPQLSLVWKNKRAKSLIKGWTTILWDRFSKKEDFFFTDSLIGKAQNIALQIVSKYYSQNRGENHGPDLIAGGALWIACRNVELNVTQRYLANLSGRTENAIRTAKNHIQTVVSLN